MNKKDSPARWSRAGETKSIVTKGKRPWQHYDSILKGKIQARKLSAIYYRAGAEVTPIYTRRGQRVAMCHDTIGVQAGKIVTCWCCGDRLCPICASKMSRRIAANARAVIERARAEADLKPYMLTLTQRNCAGSDLSARITDILAAWRSIMHDIKGQRRYIAGYARTVEITIGKDGLYHPHLHAIILVPPETPKEMLRAKYWALHWQTYMRTQEYQGSIMPVCDIRPIRANRRKGITDSAAAAAEVAKYMSKSGEILSHEGAYERIITIDGATCGRRLRTYGGVWKRIRAEMKLEDSIATEPPTQYLADMAIEIWQFAGMEKREYTRIV